MKKTVELCDKNVKNVKTEYLLIGSEYNINNLFRALKVHVCRRVKETKALGAYIDEFLSWNKGIGAVRKLKPHVDHNTLIIARNFGHALDITTCARYNHMR